jgi:hypothetical protein
LTEVREPAANNLGMTPLLARHAAVLIAMAAFAQASSASSLEEPPPGLRQTGATLTQVLERYDQAAGKALHETRAEQWSVAERGLTGTYAETDSGDDYCATLTLGPFVTMSGRRHGQSWRQDENGLTILRQDIHQKTAVSEKALGYALDHPQAPGPGISLLGEATQPVDAYVVQIHPDGGRLVWLFFDAATGLIDRDESVIAERRIVTQYDDFRTTGGITEAWHHRVSDGRPANDEDWTLTTLRFDAPVTDAALAIPPDRRALVEFPAGATVVHLPARIVNGKVIVRLTVQGRGLDFLLDSGAGDIAFDADVAASLHLQPIGKATQEIAGQFDRSRAIVPLINVGQLVMRDVVVSTIPFQASPDVSTRVVGLLGFDFFKNAVVRVDYEHGTVDAYDPAGFSPPPSAVTLPVALDDGVPLVSATVGEDRGDHFILDTGSAYTIIFSGFAADHPDAVADQGGGSADARVGMGVSARGVGGQIRLVPTELKVFRFAGTDFEYFKAYVTVAARALEREDEDGLIGVPTLQRFVVYFDYSRQRVALIRNGLRM